MIEGARVALRPLGQGDRTTVGCWESEYHVEASPEGDRDQHLAGPAGQANRGSTRTARMFAIEARDGATIGCAGFVAISWRKSEAELVIAIDDDRYRGKGYGTEAVCLLLDYGFSHTKLGRVYLRVLKDNARAIRCFEKCGFRKEWIIARRFRDGEPMRKVILMTLDRKDFLEAVRCREAS